MEPTQPPATSSDEEVDRETMDALVALGLDEDEARSAVVEQRVPLALVENLVGEERRYSLSDIAERGDVDEDVLRRIFMALGLPLQESYGESDLQEAEQLGQLLDVFSEDTLVRLARVRGISMSRIAMGDLDAIRSDIVAPMRDEGADDLTIAVGLAETAKALLPTSSDLLVHAYRRALVHALSSEVVRAAAREPGQELELTVGFTDLVGYTALSARVDPMGLEEVLEVFERRVLDVVGRTEEVSLVKFLGDAAMFVSVSPVAMAETLNEVIQERAELEEAPLRAGMARGRTLVREGDYFGPAVNLAARLTDRARPWSLLADPDLYDDLEDQFRLSRIRPMSIRGIGLTRPVAVGERRHE